MASGRIDWVDYAKGFCIIFVVMMHSTLGVEKAAGAESWMHAVIEFAAPFRMPDFFLISGLFLARVIDRDWRDYLDRKLVHFAYFYVLWLVIQFAFKMPGFIAEFGWDGAVGQFLLAFVNPFGTMWFIYVLPIFFVTAKLLRNTPIWLVIAVAAVLQMAPVETGWTVIDQFAERFVFFYIGYVAAGPIFRFADWIKANDANAVTILLIWAMINGGLVFNGYAGLPGISLVLGLFGAVAVVTVSALLSKFDLMAPLRYCGRNSIAIYLAFFLPMAAARVMLLKLGIVDDIGTVAVIVTAAGVAGPLVLHALVKGTPLRWLFERPDWARLAGDRRRFAASAAE